MGQGPGARGQGVGHREGAHGLLVEHVLDEAVGLVLVKLVPVSRNDASRVLTTVLEHEEPLVNLRSDVPLPPVHPDDATFAHDRPAGVSEKQCWSLYCPNTRVGGTRNIRRALAAWYARDG